MIISGFEYNFKKLKIATIDSRGTPYDYDSVMHYGGKFFSKNRRLTIQTKNPADQHRIGQRRGFSAMDIKQINLMYCKRGGYGGIIFYVKNITWALKKVEYSVNLFA